MGVALIGLAAYAVVWRWYLSFALGVSHAPRASDPCGLLLFAVPHMLVWLLVAALTFVGWAVVIGAAIVLTTAGVERWRRPAARLPPQSEAGVVSLMRRFERDDE